MQASSQGTGWQDKTQQGLLHRHQHRQQHLAQRIQHHYATLMTASYKRLVRHRPLPLLNLKQNYHHVKLKLKQNDHYLLRLPRRTAHRPDYMT